MKNLTPREAEILDLISNGQTSNEISKILFVEKCTIDTHRKNILRKLNCKNLSQAVKIVLSR